MKLGAGGQWYSYILLSLVMSVEEFCVCISFCNQMLVELEARRASTEYWYAHTYDVSDTDTPIPLKTSSQMVLK